MSISQSSSYWIQCTFENSNKKSIGKSKSKQIRNPDKAWETIETFIKKQVDKQFNQNDAFVILFESNELTIESKDEYDS